MALTFPGIAVSGCTTAGEILPEGMSDGAILAIAFPEVGFTIHSDLISPLESLSVESVGETVRRLKSNLIQPPPHQDHVFALMIETDVPFKVFKTSNFDPTAIKLVVTAADTTNRTVFELNAEPAAREYAAAIGLLPNDLGPFSFASYPLVVKVGGDYYCRSIRNMNPDGSLTFFCAIDEGLVFTVASPQDMLKSAEQTLTEVERALGSVDLVLGFDCILRRLDAENRQIRHQVDKLYRQFKLVGFHSYGEQFNAMHLNQTLTGIAFGPRRPAQNDPTP